MLAMPPRFSPELFRNLVDIYTTAVTTNSVDVVDCNEKIQRVPQEIRAQALQLAQQRVEQAHSAALARRSPQPPLNPLPIGDPPSAVPLPSMAPDVSATAIIKSPSTAVSLPEVTIEGEHTDDGENDGENDKDQAGLTRIGKLLEQGYRAMGMNVAFESACDQGLRCNRYVLRKPVSAPFLKLQKCEDVLSNAGFDPHIPITFRPLPHNKFEIHIPRAREEWRSCNLFHYLPGFSEASVHLKQGDYLGFFETVRRNIGVQPWDDLQARFAVDLDGDSLNLMLSLSAIFAGAPGMGKSVGIETVAESLCLAYPPEWLEIYCIDFKGGKSLKKMQAFPHVKRVLTSRDATGETVIRLFDELRQQRLAREQDIAAAGCADIREYNRHHPKRPIPWMVVLDDEAAITKKEINAAMKSEVLQDSIEYWMGHGLSTLADCIFNEVFSLWRSDGIVYVGGTQYPRGDRAWDKAVRMCAGSSVAYQCSPESAKMVFEAENARTRHWMAMAPNLYPGGDCVINNSGQFCRAQTLWLPPDDQRRLLYFAQQAWGTATVNQEPLLPPVQSQPQPRSQAEQVWQRIQAAIDREGDQISINKMLQAAYGSKAVSGSGHYKPKLIQALRQVGQTRWAEWVERGGKHAS
jgi:hypothetical protein